MSKTADRLDCMSTPYIYANVRECTACWRCINACPGQLIGKVGFLWHRHIVIRAGEDCTGCQKCVKACPRGVFVRR